MVDKRPEWCFQQHFFLVQSCPLVIYTPDPAGVKENLALFVTHRLGDKNSLSDENFDRVIKFSGRNSEHNIWPGFSLNGMKPVKVPFAETGQTVIFSEALGSWARETNEELSAPEKVQFELRRLEVGIVGQDENYVIFPNEDGQSR